MVHLDNGISFGYQEMSYEEAGRKLKYMLLNERSHSEIGTLYVSNNMTFWKTQNWRQYKAQWLPEVQEEH